MTLARKEAYDEAVAVFSPAVQFVEWKMYEVDGQKPPYYPFAIKGVKTWDTWAEIDGERWIYAFRRQASDAQSDAKNTSPAVLVDELFLDDKGKLHGIDTDKLFDGDKIVERDDRPKPQEIGDTVSFVRQLFGVNLDYWFFGSRIRLPSAALKKIMSAIPLWTSRTRFSPDDPNVVWTQTPRVPILDPITVARYLHTYFVSAANDLLKYLAPVDDPDDRDSDEKKKNTAKRQKKLALAHIVDGLLEADSGDLGTRSKMNADRQGKLFDFLTQYTEQVEYRTKWRDRWATWLSNWLASDPIAILADAYMVDEEHEFPTFFLNMALCHSRLNETKPGRDLLTAHFSTAPKYMWIRKYVLGREGELKNELVQAIRKTGSAPIEFIKEHVPVWMAKSLSDRLADEIEHQLNELFGEDHVVAQKFTTASGSDLYMTWVKTGNKDVLKFGEIDTSQILTANKKLELSPKWHGAVGSLAAGLELINFGLKVRAFAEEYEGDDLYKKLVAFLELVSAGLDLTAAGVFLLGASERTFAKFGFASAAIDAVISFAEAGEAFFDGKFGKALGASVVGIGSVVVAAAFLFEVSAVPIGLIIVALGYMIEMWFGDDNDYQLFVAHSSFGDDAGAGDDKPGWYTTEKTFRDWAGDLDEQLCAAVMLLCKFEIEPDDDDARARYKKELEVLRFELGQNDADARADGIKAFGETMRSFTLKMRWIPTGAKLHFGYFETWKPASDMRTLNGTLELRQEGPHIDSADMTVDAKDLQSIEVHPHAGKALTTADYGLMNRNVIAINVVAWLVVEMFGKKYEVRANNGNLYLPAYGDPY